MLILSVLLVALLFNGTQGASTQTQLQNQKILTKLEDSTESSNENKFQNVSFENASDESQSDSNNSSSETFSPPRHINKLSVDSKKIEKQQIDHSNLKDDNIQFRDNKRTVAKIPDRQGSVFFTQSQKNQHLHFPNDFENPNNRLQPTPEEVAAMKESTKKPEDIKQKSSEEKGVSFFSNSSYYDRQKVSKVYPKDAIHTMDVAFKIMRNSVWGENNVVFSPLSICNVLALLMLGANGRSLEEISKVLNVQDSYKLLDDEKIRRFHVGFQKLLELLHNKSGKNVSIEIANQIFTDKTFDLQSAYLSDAKEFYQTPVESFDFGQDGKLFREKVNEWVRIKTNGKIKSIIDEPPSPLTTLAFVNAVYFKGDWEVPFAEKITRKQHFFVKENETIQVPMMANILTVPYLENNDFQMAGIPYKGNRTGFFVILPKSINGNSGIQALQNLERTLTAKDLSSYISNMKSQKLAVKIPKMKISTDGHMKDILTTMGVPSIFDRTLANFSRISSDNGLYVSAVHHRAMVEINEKGTEAAAVTIGTGDRTLDELPIPFIANKPFLFFIHHVKADTVLFLGRVIRP